jgi:YHS domain-containing protein
MRRALLSLLILAPMIFLAPADAGGDKAAAVKEALQALQDYIGGWKGNGTSEKDKSEIWKENASWSWRFKGKDTFLTFEAKDGKLFKSGELRFLPEKEKYQLTLIDKKDVKRSYEGELKKDILLLEGQDPATKNTDQLKINLAGGGVRLVMTVSTRLEGRTVFNKQYQVSYTKEGESFGATAKKNECVVTGGLGTMTVSFMGQTYYVCCGGCRDAFNENPAKIVQEYLAKKKR